MRLLRFALVACLLAPFVVLAQTTPFYLADGLDNFTDQQLKQSNPVYVTLIGQDSLIISPDADSYKYASTYKRNAGEFFFRRRSAFSSPIMNYVVLYPHSVILIEQGSGSYLLFATDKTRANQLLANNDKTLILAQKDSLKTAIAAVVDKQSAARSAVVNANNKKIMTAYIRNLQSKRSDPTLVRDIKKWSQNTTTTVYIVDAGYYITKNVYGQVLNKNIPAIIKYHLNGKCFVQWRAFGYEALGGGAFSTDLNTYNKPDEFIHATGAGGWVNMDQGVAYEVDCD
jgi:hypothetical protein